MSTLKKIIAMYCLLITSFLVGCSNNNIASKTNDLTKLEANQKVTFTENYENQILKKAYDSGKKDMKMAGKDFYYPAYILGALSVDVSTEFGEANIDGVYDTAGSVDYKCSCDRLREILFEIDDKFISISESNQDSIEDISNQKNELTKKVLSAYIYGLLDRAIQDMETVNEHDLDLKLYASDSSISKEKVEFVKGEFLKFTDYYKSMLIDIKNNYNMDPIDKSIYETSKEEILEFHSFVFDTLQDEDGSLEQVYLDTFLNKSYLPTKTN